MIAIGLVSWRIYKVWQDEPLSPPQQSKAAVPLTFDGEQSSDDPTPPPVNPETIISKNLFDPERGAGATRVAEFNSQSFQRVRNLVLLGTVILGDNRSAILQDGSAAPGVATASAQVGAPMRVKLGDSVEGFSLTEISERRVVFTKGGARVELPLDYFRKTDPPPARGPIPGQVGSPRSIAPRVVPNLPRRSIPAPANNNPES